MGAAWPGTGVDLWTVEPYQVANEPYQVANEARQRLLTIRVRLAELEIRRVQLSTSTASAITLDGLQRVDRARRATEAAVTSAAEAKRRVRKLYLNSARVHEYVAGRYEVGANSYPLQADHYRRRAAWHRHAANQDRLNAERISPPDETPNVLSAVRGAAEGARQAVRR